jgi:trk system potassium uptake protein TrkH
MVPSTAHSPFRLRGTTLPFLDVLRIDLLSGFSASAAAMGNVGPRFGLVSSLSNFALIPTAGKWLLTLVMLLGCLEIYGLRLFVILGTWR